MVSGLDEDIIADHKVDYGEVHSPQVKSIVATTRDGAR
jgi:hypothetical protein